MDKEEFICKFYSCDNEEQFLKDIYHNLNCLQQENKILRENYDRIYAENCKLREEHNINDISLLDENYRLKKGIDKAIEYIKEMTANELNYINYKGKTICICGSDFNSGADIILDILNEVSE